MQRQQQHTWMFRVASRVFVYFLWGAFGFGVVCTLAQLIGAFALIKLFWAIAGGWILRAVGVMLCMLVAGLVVESAC